MSAERAHADDAAESLLADVIDEITQRLNSGESVRIEDYAAKYPEIAESLTSLVGALTLLHQPGLADVDDASTSDIEPHGRLGDFNIIREIGRGGMGVVYEAEQISIGRRVALKVLPFAAILDKQQLIRFKNEARAAGSLDHPHIVPVYAVGEDRGVHYFAMRLVDGQSLADVLDELRVTSARDVEASPDEFRMRSLDRGDPQVDTVPIAAAETSTHAPVDCAAHCCQVAELGVQAARALAYAHDHGIVHRDVKPGNLLVDSDGKLYVTDFGLARTQFDTQLSMSGDVLGTLRYMSPEQARGQHAILDGRTDVYALGASLYELLTLRPAIPGRKQAELVRNVAEMDPVRPRRLRAAIPGDLETIVMKAIEKDPEDRYPSMHEFASDLQRFVEGRPIHARRPDVVYRCVKWLKRHGHIVGGAFAATLLVAVVALLAWHREAGLRRTADFQRTRAEGNLDAALDVVSEIGSAAKQLKFFLDPAFSNDEIVTKMISQLEDLARKSDDQRIVRELATLYGIQARNNSLLGLDSLGSARTSVDLATELYANSPNDPSTVQLLGFNYNLLAIAEMGCGRCDAACEAAAECLRVCEQGNSAPEKLAWAHRHYAVYLRHACRIQEADTHARKAVEFARRAEVTQGAGAYSLVVREQRLKTLMDVGAWDAADRLADETLRWVDTLPLGLLHEQSFRRYWKAKVLLTVGTLRNAQQSTDLAIESIQTAMDIFAEQQLARLGQVWPARELARCHLHLSDSLALQQDMTGAGREIREAIRELEFLGHDYDLNEAVRARFRLAVILHHSGRESDAIAESRMASEHMRQNAMRLPGEAFHMQRLLIVLTLSPWTEQQNVALAASTADHAQGRHSGTLARYRALAYSNAGLHERALACLRESAANRQGEDAVDLLIDAIVSGQAGSFDSALPQYKAAVAAIRRGDPVNYVDTGPLVIPYLQSRVEEILKASKSTGDA